MTLNEAMNSVNGQILHNPTLCTILGTPKEMEHAVCGLTEEAGEVAGLMKREAFRNQPQPRERWVEELGDVLWYLAAVCIAKGISLQEVWDENHKKLEARYGPFDGSC